MYILLSNVLQLHIFKHYKAVLYVVVSQLQFLTQHGL